MEDMTHLWKLFWGTGVASCPKSGRDHFYAASKFHLQKDLNFSLGPNSLCAKKKNVPSFKEKMQRVKELKYCAQPADGGSKVQVSQLAANCQKLLDYFLGG